MFELTLNELADSLAERVWERFDLDVEELVEDTTLASVATAAEDDTEVYEGLLIEFVARLLTPEALTKAANRAATLASTPRTIQS